MAPLIDAAQYADDCVRARRNEHHLALGSELIPGEAQGARRRIATDARVDRVTAMLLQERETQLGDARRVRQSCLTDADARSSRRGVRHLGGQTAAAEEIVRPAALRRLRAPVPSGVGA